MIVLPITASDMATVTPTANGRQDNAERKHLKNQFAKPTTLQEDRFSHVIGCIGELKCAQFFGMPFDDSDIGVLTNIDCKVFEVRTRNIETGRDLSIEPQSKMRLPHVLVWVDRKHMQATIVGWLCGWEGRERAKAAELAAGFDVWWRPAVRTWFIPPPYHSVKSLQDWIECGAPLHWAPEAYA
jgi:hypothetical protein